MNQQIADGQPLKNKPTIEENKMVFIKCDYSGQELRVLAEVSQDRKMIDAFKNNLDLHLLTANHIFNLGLSSENMCTTHSSYEENKSKYANKRHKAKNGVNFPIIYGKTERSLAKDFNISVQEAQRWMDTFFELYPDVKKAIALTRREVERQGYVTTLMGRRRRFPNYHQSNQWEQERMIRQAFNFKIQGFSADMMKIAAIKVSSILSKYNSKIVLSVHDELVYECPEDKAKELAGKIKEIMEDCVCLSIPIVVDVSIISNYGN